MSLEECSMDRVLLEEYTDGLLNQAERILVEEHVKSCRHCRKLITEYKLLFWEIENLADRQIDYPDELRSLGAGLIARSPAKASALSRTVEDVINIRKRAWAGVAGVVKSIPLPVSLKRSEKADMKQEKPSMAKRLAAKLGSAGKTAVKRRFAHLLGGTR